MDLSNYLVSFDEDDERYVISFLKPYKRRVLGGGGARVLVRKSDFEVLDFHFYR